MSLQEHFINFNNKIHINQSTRDSLKDKRRVITNILSNTEGLPDFTVFNQGSYGMYLGVEPITGSDGKKREYDIDVALRFSENKDDWNPLDIKKKIRDALDGHTEYGAAIKKPCVTVTYKKDDQPAYHVDVVPYMYEDLDDEDSQLYIAKGKTTSDAEDIKWEKADPKALVDYINDSIDQGEERDQFRRVVRYLKRWKQRRFSPTGHEEPASIGITLIVLEHFDYQDGDDLQALINAVESIQNEFVLNKLADDGTWMYKISYSMPSSLRFEPGNNLFDKMSEVYMNSFKQKIDKLADDLKAVQDEPDEIEQCKKLQKIFGEDFEVPEAAEVSKQQKYTYIPRTSSSGDTDDQEV